MKYLDLILGMLAIAYYFVLKIFMWNLSFSKPILLMGLVLIIYHFVKNKLHKNKLFKRIKKFIKPLVIAFMIVFLLVESCIIFFALKKDTTKTDYIIVLGAGLYGERMSLVLMQRMDTLLEYLKYYDKGEKIVLSGGQGPGEDIPEAIAMKRYLLEKGISEDRIIVEDKSTSTYENFKFSKEAIENQGVDIKDISIKIITNNFHSFRGVFLAKRNGFKDIEVYSAPLNIWLTPYYIREFFALGKSIVFDR
ncbi:YdcF family protein [Clostridium tarantellae]|uniref:YdcF family protein n=1 Tax=Clostridium tarantellae TaxID=39493 RepID=A0A6I1MM57_9CLOT|nr:YdcF family protein [Clostridium tarantellae]MPQ43322.1 YdcF family protein [Clostridium tarantellae]